jgi:hypothetical protein
VKAKFQRLDVKPSSPLAALVLPSFVFLGLGEVWTICVDWWEGFDSRFCGRDQQLRKAMVMPGLLDPK